jgi:glycosyltransferase involved in cell wall biosynthesis
MAPRALLYTRFNEFEPIRGADVLAAVLLQAPHARLDIVGDGPVNRVQAFFRQLERRGVLNRTKWHGLLRGDSLGKALSSDGVVIWLFEDNHTNRARSPAKLLELLAHGNAVIAERVGEVERLVSSAALTVAPGDAAELLGAAVRLFDDEIERQELRRKAAWHAAARCSWADRAALLERFLCT